MLENTKIILKEIERIYIRFIFTFSSAFLSPRGKVSTRALSRRGDARGARITRDAADLVEEIRATLGRYTGPLKEGSSLNTKRPSISRLGTLMRN